ncbi:MAG: serine/threonine protein kinase, partial [Candidatus Riflebacteria bacterium]|nr:serine/threonine protein kinase [Candidatus Riflebacteria bacterium]
HIVRVLDSGELDGHPYYTMEIVSGKNLSQVIADQGPQALDDVIRWMVQAADALDYIHRQRLCHRDVKLQNLMVDDAGNVVVMDFGLARAEAGTLLTRTGQIMGTPRYFSPEALTGKEAAPPQDVYALALCTHELLIGRAWVQYSSYPELMQAIFAGRPPTLATVRPAVPTWLIDLQEATIVKDPTRRPTAAAYRDALRNRSFGRTARRRPETVGGAGRRSSVSVSASGAEGGPSRAMRLISDLAIVTVLVGLGLWLTGDRSATTGPPRLPGASPERGTAGGGAVRHDFPCPRALRVVVSAAPRGSRVELTAAGRSLATARVEGVDGEVWFQRLVPGTQAQLRVVGPDGRPLGDPVPIACPDLVRIHNTVCWPTDRAVFIDFDLEAPAPVTVEVGRWPDAAAQPRAGPLPALQRQVIPAGQRHVRHLFAGLRPATEYFVRATVPAGGGGLADHRFRTLSEWHSAALANLLEQVQRYQVQAGQAWDFFFSTPDERSVPTICRLVEAAGALAPRSLAIHKIAWLGIKLRSPEIAGALRPLVELVNDEDERRSLIRAVCAGRHPQAPEICQQYQRIGKTIDLAEFLASALATRGGREACDALATLIESRGAWRLTAQLVRCDRGAAGGHILRWVQALQRGRQELMGCALRGLAALGDDDSLRRLTGFVGPRADPRLRSWAASEIACTVPPAGNDPVPAETPGRARAAVLAALVENPTDRTLIWAAARLGLQDAAPVLARVVSSGADAGIRRDAACAVGMTGGAAEVPALSRALSDRSPLVSAAAAWALARLGDRSSRERLIALATSPGDLHGAGAWALATLHREAAGAPLCRTLAGLLGDDARPGEGRLAVLIWALTTLSWKPSADDLRRLADDPRRSSYLRKLARDGAAHLSKPAGGPFRPFGLRPATSHLGRLHLHLPIVPFERTGIYLYPGESVAVRGTGLLVRPEASGRIAGPSAGAGARPGEVHSRVWAIVGETAEEIGLDDKRLVASRPTEVLLSTSLDAATCRPEGPTPDWGGMAWIVVER